MKRRAVEDPLCRTLLGYYWDPLLRVPRREDTNGRLNSGHSSPSRRGSDANPAKPILGPEASAELRDRLLVELTNPQSGDEMTAWAHRCLPEKNTLTAADAERVEEAFRARLAAPLPPLPPTRLRARK